MDKGEITALILFDLSADFDTIDHATLTDKTFRLKWNMWAGSNLFSSYLDKVTLVWSSTGFCAGTSAFYSIHYSTQRNHLQFLHKPPSLCR